VPESNRTKVVVYHDPRLEYPDEVFGKNDISIGINFILKNLGMDCRGGNPFRKYVAPGDSIVIKPNLVDYRYSMSEEKMNCTTTHGSLLLPIVEYACSAVGRSGTVNIVDSPIERSDFETTSRKLGLNKVVSHFTTKGYNVMLLDLRNHRVTQKFLTRSFHFNNRQVSVGFIKKIILTGDPLGYKVIDLGNASAFCGHHNIKGLRHYKPYFKGPTESHTRLQHKYSISNTVLRAKLIVSIPKMKTHQGAGVSLALKSNIGMTNRKTWLPHFTEGCPPHGDQYETKPSLWQRVEYFFGLVPLGNQYGVFLRVPKLNRHGQIKRTPIYGGSWGGNDTLWRTILDMSRVVEYTDIAGNLQNKPQRRILNIMDGIVCGEGNGPLGATPKHCGLLLGSFDMHNMDVIAANLMGLNAKAIRFLKDVSTATIQIVKNVGRLPSFEFTLPDKWEECTFR
jgi:uncharacterized protein (DUF362 family)